MDDNLTAILTQIETLISAITDVENVYKRKIAYRDNKHFETLFKVTTDDKYLGFQIYRSGYTADLTSFSNKIRHIHTLTINGIIGIIENSTTPYYSYDKLQTLMQNMIYELNTNLTLSGEATDSELASLGMIDMETKVGKVFWTADITHIVYKDEITGSIS